MTLLPKQMSIWSINTDLWDLIAWTRNQDCVIVDALEALKTHGTLLMQSSLSNWKTEDNLMFYKNRCYVPDDKELRRNVVAQWYAVQYLVAVQCTKGKQNSNHCNATAYN